MLLLELPPYPSATTIIIVIVVVVVIVIGIIIVVVVVVTGRFLHHCDFELVKVLELIVCHVSQHNDEAVLAFEPLAGTEHQLIVTTQASEQTGFWLVELYAYGVIVFFPVVNSRQPIDFTFGFIDSGRLQGGEKLWGRVDYVDGGVDSQSQLERDGGEVDNWQTSQVNE